MIFWARGVGYDGVNKHKAIHHEAGARRIADRRGRRRTILGHSIPFRHGVAGVRVVARRDARATTRLDKDNLTRGSTPLMERDTIYVIFADNRGTDQEFSVGYVARVTK